MAISMDVNTSHLSFEFSINSRFCATTHILHRTMELSTRIKLVSCFYRGNCSPKQALRLYRNETGERHPPCCETSVTRLIQRFEKTGSVADEQRSGRPSVPQATVSKVEESLMHLKERHPLGICSSANVSDECQVPHSTVKKILRDRLHLHPYQIRRVQELKETDYEKRLKFASFFIDQCAHDRDFINTILWTDEAHFFLDGCVYTRNCVIWAASNPHATSSASLHPAKVTVWAGFTATHIVPPFFFDGTIDGDRYLDALRNYVVPFLRKKRILSKITFQQDGAPPHIKKCVTEYLNDTFGPKVISRNFDQPWPPRSPDLTPADFWFWGAVKQRVYQRSPTTLEELKKFITEEICSISSDELQKSCASVLTRLQMVRENGGGHVEA